jgi:uncharacterized LabA/DUF88 family protein
VVTKKTSRGNYAFIDNQNLNLGVQKLGWKMDWRKFRLFLKETYNVEKAYMFIGHMPEHEDMYLKMHELGYLVVLKPTFDMTRVHKPELAVEPTEDQKPEEKKPVKGNVDAELVLWAVKEMKNYDKAVIVSGDGDFYSLVEYLASEDKLLNLLAPNGQYSNLYNAYERYIDRIDRQRSRLAYRINGRAKKPSVKAQPNT